MHVARHGYEDIITLLTENNASITMVNDEGQNALKIAKKYKNEGCIKLLKARKRYLKKQARAKRQGISLASFFNILKQI